MDRFATDRDREISSFSERRGVYQVHYARSGDDRVKAQRLRFDVFARELGASLQGAASQLDVDPLDERVDHLLVIDRRTDECVGTYRLATQEQVGFAPGFYTQRIFVMDRLEPRIAAEGVELGRACVALSHRNRGVFQLLLRGIGAYLGLSQKRFLFGCGSVMLKDPSEADFVRAQVEREGWLDLSIDVEPTAAYRLPRHPFPASAGPGLPPLLFAYCALGARIAPLPAYDPDFKSLDFFVLLDLHEIHPRNRARYCEGRG